MLLKLDVSYTSLMDTFFSNYLFLIIPGLRMLNIKHSEQIYCVCCICVWIGVFEDIVCVCISVCARI